MGAANVIPGVSGGTVAFLTGIYERLINSIKSFDINAVKLLLKFKIREFSEKIDELEAKLNEQIEKSAELKKSHDVLVRERVFNECASDLADTEVEKFKSLAEEVDFSNEESFKEKLDQLKESYFPKVKKEATETIDNVETGPAQDIDMTDSMAAYTKAISNHGKGFDTGATK